MYTPYVRFSNPTTQLDNAAKNALGAIYAPPSPYPSTGNLSVTTGQSAAGYGAPPVFKYVYFNAAAAPSAQIAPSPVYWADESFTTVTPDAAAAFFVTGGAMVAGYWMPNSTALGLSAVNTAAIIGATFQQSYGWIQIAGFLPGALVPSTLGSDAAGNAIQGLTTGSWASTSNAALQASGRVLGIQLHASASSLVDVLVAGYTTFWGS